MKNKTVQKNIVDTKRSIKLKSVKLTEAEQRISALESLLLNPGWDVMVEALRENIRVIQIQVLTKVSLENSKELTEKECDDLRARHEIFTELVDKPQKLLKDLRESAPSGAEHNYDPYYS